MPQQNLSQDELIKLASQKLGIDGESAKQMGDKEKQNELLNKLSDKDKEKVSKVLSDPELTKKILSSPQAKSLFKNLFGEKQNGN
ncbi:MAG: hypothetical protein E7539_03535 [Ruminococcaceae bacterium]|nr:hypothetical protein [Oscillospiraceae bacterium]